MAEWLAAMRPDLSFPQQVGEAADVNVAYCPERVLPGQVMVELIKNDRVIGGMSPVCSARASELYKIFLEGECVVTNSRTAEMCKLTENSFRDVNIAFANELSLICADQDQRLGTDPPWRTAIRASIFCSRVRASAATVSPSTRGLSWRKTRNRRV